MGQRTQVNLDVGRAAERLSIAYERERTGQEPIWQAIETNVAGFDVLSIIDASTRLKLKIEVKGSRMNKNEASFFVTRNEWNTAIKSTAFQFHLWLVRENAKLFVVAVPEMERHIPSDSGAGRWETAQLFFRDFGAFEIAT